MHPAIRIIKQTIVYADFKSDEVEKVLKKHIERLGEDLQTVDYEMAPDVEASIKAVEDIISEFEEQQTAIKKIITNSDVEDDEEDED